jgi:hypothetical protein
MRILTGRRSILLTRAEGEAAGKLRSDVRVSIVGIVTIVLYRTVQYMNHRIAPPLRPCPKHTRRTLYRTVQYVQFV